MDAHPLLNGTSARHGALAETMLFAFNYTVLTLTLLLGLPGNLWVCWVVFRTRSLRTFDNALLVSLAAGDLLKCAVDAPLLLASVRSAPLCTLQQFSYALCSCVQLLTLVGISVERFQAIAFPFQTERRKARVRVWIACIWACGLVLALVSLILSREALCYLLCRPHGTGRPRYWDPFGAYVLVPVWALSLAVIVVHYVRIFRVVRQHRRTVFSGGIEPRPAAGSEDLWASAPRTVVLLVAEAGASHSGRRAEILGAVCFLTPGAKERGKKHLEGKLAQRFGYIIIVFTLSWVPMVVILLLNVMSQRGSVSSRKFPSG